ncbi:MULTISPECIES: DUF2934 domain-containing protein [unclassified Streptomyces]
MSISSRIRAAAYRRWLRRDHTAGRTTPR